jgi:alpha-tubulin suppressor-like RCC1 family protein
MPVTILQPTIGSISIGDTHICAEQNGDLYCWGDNFDGQLGNDDGVGEYDPSPPVLVTY